MRLVKFPLILSVIVFLSLSFGMAASASTISPSATSDDLLVLTDTIGTAGGVPLKCAPVYDRQTAGRIWSLSFSYSDTNFNGIMYSDNWGASWTLFQSITVGDHPTGIKPCLAMDSQGNFYFADSVKLYRIDRVARTKTTVITWYPAPGGDSWIWNQWHWGMDSSGILYTAAYQNFAATGGQYVWKSTDATGSTWTRVDQFVTNYPNCKHVHSIHVNPYNDKVYVSLGDDDSSRGLFVSSDGLSTAASEITDASNKGPTGITFTSEATYSSTDAAYFNGIKSNDDSVTTYRIMTPFEFGNMPIYFVRAAGSNELWATSVDDGGVNTGRGSALWRFTKSTGVTSPWTSELILSGYGLTFTGTNLYAISHDGTGIIPSSAPYVFVSLHTFDSPAVFRDDSKIFRIRRTITTSNSGLFVNPAGGTELVSDPGLEGTYTGGFNALFSAAGVGAEETTDVHGGSKAQAWHGNGAYQALYVYEAATNPAGKWYRGSGWYKRTVCNFDPPASCVAYSDVIYGLNQDSGVSIWYSVLREVWTQNRITARGIGNNAIWLFATNRGAGATYDNVIFDDLSVKELRPSEIMSAYKSTSDGTWEVSIASPPGQSQIGMVFGSSSSMQAVTASTYSSGATSIRLKKMSKALTTNDTITDKTTGATYAIQSVGAYTNGSQSIVLTSGISVSWNVLKVIGCNYADDSYALVYWDGNDRKIKLETCVAGTWTSVYASAAQTYSGNRIRVAKTGTSVVISLWSPYEWATLTTQSISASVNGTWAGMFSTDVTNRMGYLSGTFYRDKYLFEDDDDILKITAPMP